MSKTCRLRIVQTSIQRFYLPCKPPLLCCSVWWRLTRQTYQAGEPSVPRRCCRSAVTMTTEHSTGFLVITANTMLTHKLWNEHRSKTYISAQQLIKSINILVTWSYKLTNKNSDTRSSMLVSIVSNLKIKTGYVTLELNFTQISWMVKNVKESWDHVGRLLKTVHSTGYLARPKYCSLKSDKLKCEILGCHYYRQVGSRHRNPHKMTLT